MNARSGAFLAFLGLFAILVVGFVGVLELRFATGEIYPHYSSLRTDPLGAQALYESFENLPGYAVSRNRRSLMSIDSVEENTALWLVGLSRQSFRRMRAPEDSPVLQAVEKDGAHLVITLNPGPVPRKFDLDPEAEEDWWERREKLRREGTPEEEETEGETPTEEDGEGKEKGDEESDSDSDLQIGEASGTPLTEWLEISVDLPDEFDRPEDGWELAAGELPEGSELTDPDSLPQWRSPYHFSELGEAWRIVATVEEEPVVVSRRLGKGTVVLTTDSYFASNEALWKDPHPTFLLWLAGNRPNLVFDETIHGTVESGGAMKMIRRYRFHGIFFGLAIFVALLAWRSASSLAPGSEVIDRGLHPAETGGSTSVTGEETTAGFLSLLRRSVPRKRLLRTCVDTWRKDGSIGTRHETPGQREAIDAVLATHETSPKSLSAVEGFRQISRILANPDDFRKQDPS